LLAGYIERCRDRAATKGQISYPTPAMLLTLEKEAKQMMLDRKPPN